MAAGSSRARGPCRWDTARVSRSPSTAPSAPLSLLPSAVTSQPHTALLLSTTTLETRSFLILVEKVDTV